MVDRENTIGNLEQNIRWIEEIEAHQFPGWGNVTMAMRNAVELLKEQEPVYPCIEHTFDDIYYACGNCGEKVRGKYCPGCGRKVKWDAKAD